MAMPTHTASHRWSMPDSPLSPGTTSRSSWSSPTASPRCAIAHHILCLEDGRLTHAGDHASLLRQGDNPYARFWRAQTGSASIAP